MTWDYRVVDRAGALEIREVYYSDDGAIQGYAYDFDCPSVPAYPSGETLDELRKDLDHILEALDKPVIPYEDLINEVFRGADNRRQELEEALEELEKVAESWRRVDEDERAEGLERRARKVRQLLESEGDAG